MTYSQLPKIVRVFVRFLPGLLGLIVAGFISDCSSIGHGLVFAVWVSAFLLFFFCALAALSLTDFDL